MSEYEEHIRVGLEEGRSEEELIQALGNPKELAKEIRAAYMSFHEPEDKIPLKNLFLKNFKPNSSNPENQLRK